MLRLARALADQSGVIAVEFALLFPVMVAMLLGAMSAAHLARASIALWSAAQSIGDLVAQQTSMTPSALTDFCKGGSLTLTPFTGTFTVSAASVTRSSSGTLGLDWQDTTSCGGAALADALTSSAAYVPNPKDSVIMVRAVFVYSFPASYVLPKTLTLTRTTFSRPRSNTSVVHT